MADFQVTWPHVFREGDPPCVVHLRDLDYLDFYRTIRAATGADAVEVWASKLEEAISSVTGVVVAGECYVWPERREDIMPLLRRDKRAFTKLVNVFIEHNRLEPEGNSLPPSESI